MNTEESRVKTINSRDLFVFISHSERMAGLFLNKPRALLQNCHAEGVRTHLSRWISARWFKLDLAHFEPANDVEPHDRDLTLRIQVAKGYAHI
jgi:hypothetical protein